MFMRNVKGTLSVKPCITELKSGVDFDGGGCGGRSTGASVTGCSAYGQPTAPPARRLKGQEDNSPGMALMLRFFGASQRGDLRFTWDFVVRVLLGAQSPR